MNKNKPFNTWLALNLIALLAIFTLCYINAQNNRRIVHETVNQLAHQADTQTTPTRFSSSSVLDNYCADIVANLTKQGYELSTAGKKLVTVVDKVMACHENQEITVKSN